MHGPVGIRCAECLRPPKVETQLQAPERVKTAVGIATFEAALWIGVIATLGWVLQDPCPNLLLSGIAGGVVGWTLWRVCGRSHNRRTRLFALALGLAIPLLAAVVALAALGGTPNAQENLPLSALRVLIAMGLGGLFAWLLATLRHWDRDLF